MRVRYRARALADIEEIRSYVDKRSPIGAQNVLRSIRSGIKFIAENPYACERADDPSVRVKVLLDYPYKTFYRVQLDEIEILHIRHSARRPWEERV
jgi:plasmid stabilization system protein ParE